MTKVSPSMTRMSAAFGRQPEADQQDHESGRAWPSLRRIAEPVPRHGEFAGPDTDPAALGGFGWQPAEVVAGMRWPEDRHAALKHFGVDVPQVRCGTAQTGCRIPDLRSGTGRRRSTSNRQPRPVLRAPTWLRCHSPTGRRWGSMQAWSSSGRIEAVKIDLDPAQQNGVAIQSARLARRQPVVIISRPAALLGRCT